MNSDGIETIMRAEIDGGSVCSASAAGEAPGGRYHLTGQAIKLVLIDIALREGQPTTYESLQARCGMSSSTVWKAVDVLQARRLVTKVMERWVDENGQVLRFRTKPGAAGSGGARTIRGAEGRPRLIARYRVEWAKVRALVAMRDREQRALAEGMPGCSVLRPVGDPLGISARLAAAAVWAARAEVMERLGVEAEELKAAGGPAAIQTRRGAPQRRAVAKGMLAMGFTVGEVGAALGVSNARPLCEGARRRANRRLEAAA